MVVNAVFKTEEFFDLLIIFLRHWSSIVEFHWYYHYWRFVVNVSILRSIHSFIILPRDKKKVIVQYCAKVMQKYFAEIRSFSWLFNENISNFHRKVTIIRDAYCFQLHEFSKANSHGTKIDFDFSMENSLLICSAQTLPRIFWTIILLSTNLSWWSLQCVSFTTNSCLFI